MTSLTTTTTTTATATTTTDPIDSNWPPFYNQLHQQYICQLSKNTESYEYQVTEHLRLSGMYWGYTAMALLQSEHLMNPTDIVAFVMSGYKYDETTQTGGWAGNLGHDVHLLYTTSAIQILAIADQLQLLEQDNRKESIVKYITSLQQKDGSFAGDQWLEIDTRFSYCAMLSLVILNRLDAVDVAASNTFITSCQNFDGGYGCVPGAESHAGQIFCCVGALSIGNGLDLIDRDQLGWWLAERQCDSGGLNGRPEKQADVCYSWWVLSVLAILDRLEWIDKTKLIGFILKCQNEIEGGIADRPGDEADVFHTFFGICGLSFLGYLDNTNHKHMNVNPTFAMPVDVVERLGLKCQTYFGK